MVIPVTHILSLTHILAITQTFGRRSCVILSLLLLLVAGTASGEEIGSVDTRFRMLTPDDTVRVEVFDDPKISGIACYLSRAITGGIKGAIGVAEDTSDASIDCRQTGAVAFSKSFENGEKVFSERRSFMFKKLQVVRYCDPQRNTLVYLVYSDRVIEGSPKNSVSAVPITAAENPPRCAEYTKGN